MWAARMDAAAAARSATTGPSRSSPGRLPLGAAAFALNLAWELAHSPLYECPFSARVLAGAAVVDAAVTVGVGELAALSQYRYNTSFWPVFATGLAVAATVIEVSALRRRRRFYAPSMPTVAGLGLTPSIQLPLAGTVAAKLAQDAPIAARWWQGR